MSRVADRVGAGAFASLARQPLSERGRAKAQAAGLIPDYEVQRLDLAKVATCPMNPRRNYGTDEDRARLGESLARKQTTACVAVTRAAYLKLWPNHEKLIEPTAEHVLLNGERRYRSAQHVGLEALDFVVRDDLATSQADFMDYLLLENEDRENFDIIERARGLKQLLDACDGNAAEVARRRGKDRSWVGNQIALLTLPTLIQEQLVSGQLAERYGRRLARAYKDDRSLTSADLLALAENIKEEERAKRERDKQLRAAAKTDVLSADNTTVPTPMVPSQQEPAQDHPEAVLSADNTVANPEVPAALVQQQSPEPAVTVLSADNMHSSTQALDDSVPAAALADQSPATVGVVW
ncbi:ParB/RepB/Spo0J family partition protein [Kitasatospora sp. NPDC001175]